MSTLLSNDWIVLNHIIYQINSVENLMEMRSLLLEQLKILIDYESADFWLAATDGSNNLVEPVFYNESLKVKDTYMERLYGLDYGKGLLLSGKNMIYRETDIMPDQQRIHTDFYKEYFVPANWHHGLNLVISYQQKFLGVVAFYRKVGEPNFDYKDIFVLEMLKDHIEYRLHRDAVNVGNNDNRISIADCVLNYHLTRREETILGYLLGGGENDLICKELCITNNTLKKHILNLYRKLNIKNRMQLFKMVKEEKEK